MIYMLKYIHAHTRLIADEHMGQSVGSMHCTHKIYMHNVRTKCIYVCMYIYIYMHIYIYSVYTRYVYKIRIHIVDTYEAIRR